MLAKLSRRLIWEVKRCAQVDPFGDENQTILIAGSGRSGTTWIGEVVSASTVSRQIFEPFIHTSQRELILPQHKRHFESCDRNLYIPGEAGSCPRYDKDLLKILRGQVRRPWCDNPLQYGIHRRRVIKAIRSNLLLGYLARRWPQIRYILVSRNPCSVVNSQLRFVADESWQPWEPEYVLSQQDLMENHLQPFSDLLHSVQGHPQKLALKWCIENYVAQRETAGLDNVLQVRYEDLCNGPEYWQPMVDFLSSPSWQQDIFDQSVRQRSRTSHRNDAEIQNQRENWNNLEPAEIASINTMCQRFGLERYLE